VQGAGEAERRRPVEHFSFPLPSGERAEQDRGGAACCGSRLEILDIDDTFCAAHGGQQLAFWNAHHDERGFASMHIYHVTSGTPTMPHLMFGQSRSTTCGATFKRHCDGSEDGPCHHHVD
jgi:Transposase DDE domain group 1